MQARVFLDYKEFVFLLKSRKKLIIQQVTGQNTPVLVLKRMLRYFLKIFPLNKMLEF